MKNSMNTRHAGIARSSLVALVSALALTLALTALCLHSIREEGRAERRGTGAPLGAPVGDGHARQDDLPVPIFVDVDIPPDGSPDDPRIVPGGDAALGVALVDASGRKVSGATLRLLLGDRVAAATTTDGRAEFLDVADGSYLLRIETADRPQLITARRLVLHSGERLDVSFVLRSFDLAIAGRVVDPEGAAIAGVSVRVRRNFADVLESDLVPLDEDQQVTSSATDGSFALAGLDAGEYELRAFGSETHAPADRLVVAGTLDLEVVLEEGREVRIWGRVLDPDGGAIAGASITIGGQIGREDVSDRSGEYSLELDVRAQDSVTIEARASTFRTARRSFQPGEQPEGREWNVDLELERQSGEGAISGLVLSASGVALGGQRVELYSPGLDVRRSVVSNAFGAFEFAGLPAGDDYELRVRPRRLFRDWQERDIVVGAEPRTLDIELEAITGVRVRAVVENSAGEPAREWAFRLYSAAASTRRVSGVTDVSGFFEFEDVAAGPLVLESRAEPNIVVRGVMARADRVEDLRFLVDLGAHDIDGVVLSASGRPIAGAKIELGWHRAEDGVESTSLRTTTTSEDGAFRFDRLGPGEHDLRVSAAEFAPVRRAVEPTDGARRLDLRLEPGP